MDGGSRELVHHGVRAGTERGAGPTTEEPDTDSFGAPIPVMGSLGETLQVVREPGSMEEVTAVFAWRNEPSLHGFGDGARVRARLWGVLGRFAVVFPWGSACRGWGCGWGTEG